MIADLESTEMSLDRSKKFALSRDLSLFDLSLDARRTRLSSYSGTSGRYDFRRFLHILVLLRNDLASGAL